jgi:hypothetical protein
MWLWVVQMLNTPYSFFYLKNLMNAQLHEIGT